MNMIRREWVGAMWSRRNPLPVENQDKFFIEFIELIPLMSRFCLNYDYLICLKILELVINWLIFGVLTPLSAIFQLYYGDQF